MRRSVRNGNLHAFQTEVRERGRIVAGVIHLQRLLTLSANEVIDRLPQELAFGIPERQVDP